MQAKELTRNEILEQLKGANEEIVALKKELSAALLKPSEAYTQSLDPSIVALCMACIRDRMSQSFLEDAEFEYVAKTFVPQAVKLAKMIQEEITGAN